MSAADTKQQWKGSPSLVALYDYLVKHSNRHRFWLLISDDMPALRMHPGLTLEQGERWDVVAHAECLLRDALPDLLHYMQSGDIQLPVYNYGSFCG